ncbi:hypothetical protein ACWEO1_31425 [Kitasatospora cineracea]
MTQPPGPTSSPSFWDRPVTRRDLALCAYGALTTWALHPQIGWLAAGLAGFAPEFSALVRSR